MSTRAGTTSYDRLFTCAFIRPGLDPDRWGNRSNYVALNVVPTSSVEMSIYHSSGHCYVLRTDGFVSVRAGVEKGQLITKPISFYGDELVVNVSTSAVGSMRVEIQEPDGTPIPEFQLDNCLPIIGDEIARKVEWKGGADLSRLAGKPIRLCFVMTECDLYSIKFNSNKR
jgi:hypothetical protein